MRLAAVFLLFLAAIAVARSESALTARGFAAQAYSALPPEEPYAFYPALGRGDEPDWCDPTEVPAADEFGLPQRGWRLVMAADSTEVLRTAAGEFQTYLQRTMRTGTERINMISLANWSALRRAVVVGTRDQLPGAGSGLTGPKDYRLIVSPDSVVVCGFDEAGAMYGLFNLEERMNLRQGPILPRSLDTVRHSLFRARLTLSGLGWEEWPDPYFALLSRYGFDSIFASNFANPDGSAAPPPYDKRRRQDPAKLHDLIRRAQRYGIRIYAPILFHYTGESENERGLRDLVRRIVTEFREIRGYILLTEGFYYGAHFGAGKQGKVDLRDWLEHWDHAVAIVAEEAHRVNPATEILAWDYGVDFRPAMVAVKRYGTSRLPSDAIPLLTFESGKEFVRDGERGYLKDYAINEVGPAEVTAAQIEEAKRRGLRVYARSDTWATWQFGTFPYLPVPYQWYARYRALERSGVEGTLESWSYGFKPNFIAEMRAWYCWSGAPDLDRLLTAMARRQFGPGQESLVLRAWDHFSRAIRLLPDTGPKMGTNCAVGAPLFFQRPKPRTYTLNHSWRDIAAWSHDSEINPDWPYTHRDYILNPDFDNHLNAAEQYTAPFSLPVFLKYEALAADELETGLGSYRAAALRAPATRRAGAMREILLVEQMQRMLRSTVAILKFEDARLRLSRSANVARAPILDGMVAILKEERSRTQDALETARRDSRLGYEWEEDYLCSTQMIEEKIELIDKTLRDEIPAFRRKNGL